MRGSNVRERKKRENGYKTIEAFVEYFAMYSPF